MLHGLCLKIARESACCEEAFECLAVAMFRKLRQAIEKIGIHELGVDGGTSLPYAEVSGLKNVQSLAVFAVFGQEVDVA